MLTPSSSSLRGTPTRALRALSDAEIQTRYQDIHAYLIRNNGIPNRLRTSPLPVNCSERKAERVALNEQSRLRRIAAKRGLTLTVAAPLSAAPIERDLETGDLVHSRFHDANGEIIRLEWSGKVGGIYHVRLTNGQIVYCHKSDLVRIDPESQQ